MMSIEAGRALAEALISSKFLFEISYTANFD
jgi:hypothetical protein